jgi:hypothetical protein
MEGGKMRLHEKNSLFLGKKTNSKIIVAKASHFSRRIILGTLVAMAILMGGTSVCFGSLIINDSLVTGITGIVYGGKSYDVTFGVDSFVRYTDGIGWETEQTELVPEKMLPQGEECNFFEIVADILFNAGNPYSIVGSDIFHYNWSIGGYWHIDTRAFDFSWQTDQCFDSINSYFRDLYDPSSSDYSPELCNIKIAMVTKSPVPEPATALLLLTGMVGCYMGCRKKRLP